MPTLAEAIVTVRADNSKLKSGLRQSERATRRSTRKMEGYFKNVQRNLDQIGTQLTSIGRQLTRSGGIGLVALGGIMTGLVKPASDLQEELANVNTLFSQTAFNADEYRNAILEMSRQVPKSTKTLTEGLYQIKSAGIEAGNTLGFLKVASVAATAGVTDVETTVNALTKTLAAYGMEGDNVLDVSNKLFKAVELGNIRFGQLAEILPTATAMAASAGMSLDELFGTIATGVRTLKPEQVATGLARIITELEKASDDKIQLAESLGFQFTMDAFREKGIVQFLKDMREGLQDTDVSYREFFTRTQAARLANALLNESFDDLSENIDGVSESTDAINVAFQKQVEVLNNQARLAWNNIMALVKSVGTEMIPSTTDMIQSVRAFAEALTEAFMEKTPEAREQIGEAIVNVGKFTGALLGLIVAAGLLSMGLGLVVKAGALIAGIFSILMNPIVLLGLAMFGLYKAWENNWFGIRDITQDTYEKIEPYLSDLWDWIKRAWDWTINTAGDVWNWLTDTTWQQKIEDIKGWLSDAWTWTINRAGDAWNWLEEEHPALADTIKTMWNWSVNLVNDTAKWLYNTAWPWINNAIETSWNWTVKSMNELFNWIVTTGYPWFNNTIQTTWEFTVKGLKKLREAWNLSARSIGNLTTFNVKKNPDWLEPFKTPFKSLGKAFGFSDGTILGGYGGGDTIPAMLEKGEAVVPKEAVAGGLRGIVQWFKNKGVGFQNGRIPTSLQGAREFLSNADFSIKGTAGSILSVMRRVFDSLFDSILELAEKQFPELAKDIKMLRDEYKNTMQDLEGLFGDGGEDEGSEAQGTQQEMSFFKRSLQVLGGVAKNVADRLVQNMPILQDMIQGFKQGGLVGILSSLIANSRSFQKLLSTINPILQLLADTLGIVLLPIVKILEPPLKLVAEVLRWVAELIIAVWNGIVDVLNIIIFWSDLSHWKVSMKELGDGLGDTADAAKEAADAMRNIPQGVKIAQRAFQVATPIPSAASGGYVSKTGLVNVHAGEVISNPSQQGGMTVILQGDVYGFNDFKKKVAQANGQIKRKQNTSKYGISRGERR